MEEEVKSIKDYLLMIKRRKAVIIWPAALLSLLSIVVAVVLPPIFRSGATILIEQQHIPTELVKSTVTSYADERIHLLQQQIMTVNKINKIIKRFNLYPGQAAKVSNMELSEQFKERANLELINADVVSNIGRSRQATIAFKLSFDDRSPLIAQKVTNELVTLFLKENVRSRTKRAEETTQFLDEEAKKIKHEIRKIENKIAEFKDQYRESLPELMDINLSEIARIENQLMQSELQGKLLKERGSSLRSQLALTSPTSRSFEGGSRKVLDSNSLGELQAEYERLQSKYSKNHPDIRAIKRKIESLEKQGPKASKKSNGVSNPMFLQLRSELEIVDAEQRGLITLREQLRKKRKKLESNVSKTNQVERGYSDLRRDLENNKVKYQELKAKQMEAKLAQTLEEEQKAERFTLIEPPLVPSKPEKPDRLKLALMGLALSIGAGLGLGLLVETLDNSVRGHKHLATITGFAPLIVIPYIENQEDYKRKQSGKYKYVFISIGIIAGVLLMIHLFHLPLDVLFFKIWRKLQVL